MITVCVIYSLLHQVKIVKNQPRIVIIVSLLIIIKIKKFVKAINCVTEEVLYFYSLNAVNQHLGINAGIVRMVREGINNVKTGIP